MLPLRVMPVSGVLANAFTAFGTVSVTVNGVLNDGWSKLGNIRRASIGSI